MNNNTQKKEYSEEEIVAILGAAGKGMHPNEAPLRAMIESFKENIPSPYAPKMSPYFNWKKIAMTMLMVVLLVGGGSAYTLRNKNAPTIAMNTATPLSGASSTAVQNQIAMQNLTGGAAPVISDDGSDDGLAADEQSVNSEMAALDADNASADQSLQNI